MKSLISVAKFALPVLLTLYFIKYATDVVQNHDVLTLSNLPDVFSILICVAFYALIIPVSAFAWSRILGDLGERWSIWQLNCIMGSTQFAKYIPGNIAQHLARVSLALRKGMKLGVFTTSVLVETALAILACLAVGSMLAIGNTTIWRVITTNVSFSSHYFTAFALLALLVCGVLMSPLRNKLLILVKRSVAALRSIRLNTILITFAAYSCNYLLIGVGLVVIAKSMGIAAVLNYSLLTAAFAWAWIIGFFAPGAPAGLGVREGILALIFNQFTDATTVLTLVIALRLVTLLGDLLWFLISFIGLTVNNHGRSNA